MTQIYKHINIAPYNYTDAQLAYVHGSSPKCKQIFSILNQKNRRYDGGIQAPGQEEDDEEDGVHAGGEKEEEGRKALEGEGQVGVQGGIEEAGKQQTTPLQMSTHTREALHAFYLPYNQWLERFLKKPIRWARESAGGASLLSQYSPIVEEDERTMKDRYKTLLKLLYLR